MAVKFKTYQRFNSTKAKYGVGHSIYDEAGNYYGNFTTSLFDIHSKFIQVETERFNRESKSNPKMNSDHANVFAFVEICVHGWDDVLDENGKQVKFTKEAAFELLTMKWTATELNDKGEPEEVDYDNSWLIEAIIAKSRDVSLYQADPVAKQEEVAGN